MANLNLSVFASGGGSNFESIVQAISNGEIKVNMSLLVCDNPNAFAIERAKKLNIPCFVCNPKDYPNKESYETSILQELQKHNIDFIALAGYMRIIGSTLLRNYESRMINIHPSLLPAFPGANGISDAFNYGVKVSGVTIHWVDSGMDTGKIIAQEPVIIHKNDDIDTFATKIHAIEHVLYPKTLASLLNK